MGKLHGEVSHLPQVRETFKVGAGRITCSGASGMFASGNQYCIP